MANLTVPVREQIVGGDGKLTREGSLFMQTLLDTLNRLNTAVLTGAGSPAAVIVADVGTLYLRSDGGANTTEYIKESGNGTSAGWVAK